MGSSRRSRRRSRRAGPCAGHPQGKAGPPPRPRAAAASSAGAEPGPLRRLRAGPGAAQGGSVRGRCPRARPGGSGRQQLLGPAAPQVRRSRAGSRRRGPARPGPPGHGQRGQRGCSSAGAGEAAPNSPIRGFPTSAVFVCTASAAAAAGAGSFSVAAGQRWERGRVCSSCPVIGAAGRGFREQRVTTENTPERKRCTGCAGHNALVRNREVSRQAKK